MKFLKHPSSLFWVLTYCVMSLFSRKKNILFESDDVYKLKEGTIFILNHRNPLDPWLFFHSLPFHILIRVLPIRIYAGTIFSTLPILVFLQKIGIINLIYFLYGCVKVPVYGSSEDKLRKLCEVIEDGQSVLFFPEGDLNRKKEIGDIKNGIAILREKYKEKQFFFSAIGYPKNTNGKRVTWVIFGVIDIFKNLEKGEYVNVVRDRLRYLYNKIT